MHLKINQVYTRNAYLTGQVAYLPQGFFIPANLKVETLVQLYGKKYRKELLLIDVIQLNLKENIGNLSGGNRRLIEALLIIYSDAPFVLLDEPFSQLAPLIADELRKHIDKFKSEKGFIITDHYYRQILAIADRIVLIKNGSNYSINQDEDLILHGYLPSHFLEKT